MIKPIYKKIISWYSYKFGSAYPLYTWYGDPICNTDRRVVFPNGWVACIGNNTNTEVDSRYYIMIHDHNYNFNILNNYGGNGGILYCNNIFQIIVCLEKVRKLKDIPIF